VKQCGLCRWSQGLHREAYSCLAGLRLWDLAADAKDCPAFERRSGCPCGRQVNLGGCAQPEEWKDVPF
jgi:hypothetical protein